MPGDEFISSAINLFNAIAIDEMDFGSGLVKIRGWPHFEGFDFNDSDQLERNSLELTAPEWELAMGIFNHYAQLNEIEIDLVRRRKLPIVYAAIWGLLHVVYYGSNGRRGHILGITSIMDVLVLPEFPELKGRKYVYMRTCTPEKAD